MSHAQNLAMSFIRFRPMTTADLGQIEQIATVSFPTPWSVKTFWREIERNERGHYWVLSLEGKVHIQHRRASEHPNRSKVVSYGGYWLLGDEAHIVTVATHPDWRMAGLGKLLLLNMLFEANNAGAETVTLEVRTSNLAAIALYKSLGFIEEGRRKDYYKTGKDLTRREDALILTLTPLRSEHYPTKIAEQNQQVSRRNIQIGNASLTD